MSKPLINFRRNSLSAAIATSLLSTGAALAQVADENKNTMEEILVTATRRATSVTDVPYNISVLSGAQMERANIQTMDDALRSVPGVSFVDQGPRQAGGSSTLILRGLNLEPGNPSDLPKITVAPVSTYFGEIPLFSNLRMVDMARMEVLRGPQGTLYGSGSLGGTIRFVPEAPNPDEFEGKVWGDLSVTEASGADQNYDIGGLINFPLGDTAALRIVAGYQEQAGFIDVGNLVTLDSDNQPVLADPSDPVNSGLASAPVHEDANGSDQKYLRMNFTADVSDDVNISALVQYQEDHVGHTQYENPNADEDYVQNSGYLSPADWETLVANFEVEADLGFATLTSSTSYADKSGDWIFDTTPIYSALIPHLYYNYPALNSFTDISGGGEDFSQEFRLASNGDGPFSYVLGAYYAKQTLKVRYDQFAPGYDNWASNHLFTFIGLEGVDALGTGQIFGPGFASVAPDTWPIGNGDATYFIHRDVKYTDKALFGELTYEITDAWQVTGGFRTFEQTFVQDFESGLPYVAGLGPVWDFDASAYVCPTTCGKLSFDDFPDEDGKDTLFKFNTSYAVNDDMNVYFTWSEGFRHGGANVLPFAVYENRGLVLNNDASATKGYKSDKVTNIELGVKGRLNDGAMSYTLAVFDVDWENPQVSSADPFLGLPFAGEATAAQSRGLELELSGSLAESALFSFGYSYTDAEITEDGLISDIISQPLVDGSPLPNTSEHMVTASFDYILNVGVDAEVIFHANGMYRSDFVSAASAGNPSAPERGYMELDGYFRGDASVTYMTDTYSAKLYVSNFTGEKAYNGGADDPAPWSYITVTRPRTIGLHLGYNF